MIYPCSWNFTFCCVGGPFICSCYGKLALGFQAQWHRKVCGKGWSLESTLCCWLCHRPAVWPGARLLHFPVLLHYQVKEEGSPQCRLILLFTQREPTKLWPEGAWVKQGVTAWSRVSVLLLDMFNSAFLFLAYYLQVVSIQILFNNLKLFENHGNTSAFSFSESKSLLLT